MLDLGMDAILEDKYGPARGGDIATYVVGDLLGYRSQDIQSYIGVPNPEMKQIEVQHV